MINVLLIRHSLTLGNLNKRYIGKTDESLCEEGITLLNKKEYPDVEMVYSSPLKRCIETSQIIYPNVQKIIIEQLKECDFGDFENKNYKELQDSEQYQEWINSGGKNPFPNGEDIELFKKRCIDAFKQIINDSIDKGNSMIAIIAHGGTIMSIMEALARPQKEYYSWHLDNARGYELCVDENDWRITLRCTIH